MSDKRELTVDELHEENEVLWKMLFFQLRDYREMEATLSAAQERGSILALRVQSLEHSRRLDYELVERFDVYRTGGDLSSCLREMLMRISEMETALSERA